MTQTFPGDLSLLIFLPVVGALVLLLLPRGKTGVLFGTALLFLLFDFLWSLRIFWRFDPANGEMQFTERLPWIPAYGIDFFIGIDGLSLFLVLLTTFLGPIVILASWNINKRVKEYLFFMLIMQTSMIGTLVALDLFLFYVFWEIMLLPMYFIIGIWGGAAPHLCGCQVRHLHHEREPTHAGGHHLSCYRNGPVDPVHDL